MKKFKYINVNADASFSENNQIAAYAFHIHSADFIVRQVGIIHGNPKNSTEAELTAIEYALKSLLHQPCYKGSEKVVIFSDCMGALSKVLHPRNKRDGEVHELWKKLSNRSGKPLLKHIKAHTENKDVASKINKWCDESAREAMNKRIQEKNK